MRALVMSDLHQEMQDPTYTYKSGPLQFWFPEPQDVDCILLCGDIHNKPERLEAWINELYNYWGWRVPVIHVRGNHEYYGREFVSSQVLYDRMGPYIGPMRSLERDQVVIEGVRILGTTMWTSFGGPQSRKKNFEIAERYMNDYSMITYEDDFLRAPDIYAEYMKSVAWLDQQFLLDPITPTIVLTHHAPSYMSIPPEYAANPLNMAYASSLEGLIKEWKPKYWLHGHTHSYVDYPSFHTRIVCNARGYWMASNPHFKPDLIIEV